MEEGIDAMSIADFIPEVPIGILSGGVSSSDYILHHVFDNAKIKLGFIGSYR